MAILLYSWEAHLWHKFVHSCHIHSTSGFEAEAELSFFGGEGRVGFLWEGARACKFQSGTVNNNYITLR